MKKSSIPILPASNQNNFISFDTVVTVRSEEKGKRILDAHPDTPKEKLSYVIVKNVAEDGAFDEVNILTYGSILVCSS